ncbi:hypothetical protein GCM10023194_47640 [Planotetraspora phitsanulokensis]|uniref:Uncharacterized protein n=1 Tax=Planotetraspora phitsanulokensis TaxID=575192 RepID=A0A8J3XJL5_9ACTN|nr:hypothetical protein [Planotetraspora phitsanulokensis]GII43534.1 hypothetical protein Pph01_85370 [Planotetraspora phitsanulokensis]
MPIRVTVHLDQGQIRRLALSPTEELGRQVRVKVVQVQGPAKVYAPVRTGNLRRNINIEGPTRTADTLRWDVVAMVAYASFIHKGYRELKRGTGRVVHASAGVRPFLARALHDILG